MNAIASLLPAIVVFPFGAIFWTTPLAKFAWATFGLLFLFKIGSLIQNRLQSLPLPRGLGWIAYLFFWPGMRPESFSQRSAQQESVGRAFVEGFLFFIAGAVLHIALILFWSSFPNGVRLYLGLISFMMLIHFGISSILFSVFRMCGWPVEPLFKAPLMSTSLREFWGKRWNLAFVDMDKRVILPLFPKQFGRAASVLGVFVVSGILHEIGISYPANAGWGLPLLYFFLHGILTLIEPSVPLIGRSLNLKRIWVWLTLLIPVPLLFHESFLLSFIGLYFEFANRVANSIPPAEFLHWAVGEHNFYRVDCPNNWTLTDIASVHIDAQRTTDRKI